MEVASGRSASWELSFDAGDKALLKVHHDVRGSKSPVVSDAAARDGILPVLLTMMQSAIGVLQSLGTCRGWSETV